MPFATMNLTTVATSYRTTDTRKEWEEPGEMTIRKTSKPCMVVQLRKGIEQTWRMMTALCTTSGSAWTRGFSEGVCGLCAASTAGVRLTADQPSLSPDAREPRAQCAEGAVKLASVPHSSTMKHVR